MSGKQRLESESKAVSRLLSGRSICKHCKQPIKLDEAARVWRHSDGDRDCGLRSREVAEPEAARGDKGK